MIADVSAIWQPFLGSLQMAKEVGEDIYFTWRHRGGFSWNDLPVL